MDEFEIFFSDAHDHQLGLKNSDAEKINWKWSPHEENSKQIFCQSEVLIIGFDKQRNISKNNLSKVFANFDGNMKKNIPAWNCRVQILWAGHII